MENLRFAIIGCGKVSALHAISLSKAQGIKLCAAYDRHLDRATAFCAPRNITPYDDIARMIKEERIDAVVVTTPHPVHKEHAITAMKAGAHVLIEKPMAVTVADCTAILDCAEKCHKTVGIISQRRWYPACQRIKKAIDEDKIGKPVLGQLTMLGWRDEKYYASDPWRGKWSTEGGGVLVNQAPHQLDLLHWYLGPVKEVYGIWKNFNHPYIEVEDTAIATVQFSTGAMASILVSNSQKPGIYAKVHIHGDKAFSTGVQTDGGAMFIAGMSGILEPPVNDLWTIPGEEKNLEAWKQEDTAFFGKIDATWYFFMLEEEEFAKALLSGGQPSSNGWEGLETVKLIEGIYRSTQSGKPVIY
mgnify:CR=1 FL=1